MIDEDFDVKSTYYEAALFEAEIIQLWDRGCRTIVKQRVYGRR